MSDEKIPYGSMPPEKDEPLDTAEDLKETEQPPKEEPPKEDPVEKRFADLQKQFGEHTKLVGEVRKENQTLKQQLAAVEAQAKEREKAAREAPPPTDYEKMLADIADKLESGELSEREALIQSNKITREWTKAEAAQERDSLINQARSEVQNILSQKDADQVVTKFHEQNQDFTQLRDEGVLEQLKAEDPLLDDLAAFYKHKAMTAAQEKAAAFEQGKMEALRIKGGSEKAGKVLADPGTSMQTQQKSNKPASESEIKAAMLANFK